MPGFPRVRSPEEAPPFEPAGDEAALALRAKSDRRAFALLYDRYVDRVYGYCYRRLGTPEAAEDATALVFAKALAALPRYREDGPSFRSWLFAIAHNAIVDEGRARRPDRPLADAADLIDRAPGPEEAALAADDRRLLRTLLAKLPPDQAHLLELRLAGLTDKEIAAALGRSPGAVRVAHHRAIARLRTLLGVGTGTEEAGDA